MLLKYFIGLGIVYLVDSTDPNLGPHAIGLYLLCIGIDFLIHLIRGK